MRQSLIGILLVALGAGGFYVYDRFARGANSSSGQRTSGAAEDEEPLVRREIVALGRLQPARGIVSVSAPPGERLQSIDVSEGEEVTAKGRSLGVLASHEIRQVELEGLRAQLAAAKESHTANLQVAEAAVAQATAAVRQAEAQVEQAALQEKEIELLAQREELAKSDYEQLVELADEDEELISTKQLKRQRLAWQAAQSEYEQARLSLDVSRKSTELAVEAAKSNLVAAEAKLQQTKAAKSLDALAKQVEAAEVQERWARLPAPTSGKILKIFLRPGEFITQTPILQMADLDEIVCVAEVFEADAKHVETDDAAIISSDAFDAPFDKNGIEGKVVRVGQLISAPGILDRDPLARADRNVVEVVIAIDTENEEATRQAAQLVGLQVTVKFSTQAKSTP